MHVVRYKAVGQELSTSISVIIHTKCVLTHLIVEFAEEENKKSNPKLSRAYQ